MVTNIIVEGYPSDKPTTLF